MTFVKGVPPEFNESHSCPEHKEAGTYRGYGLAGGGIGPYTCCLECDRIVSKTVEREPFGANRVES